jgi:hypothetical protein
MLKREELFEDYSGEANGSADASQQLLKNFARMKTTGHNFQDSKRAEFKRRLAARQQNFSHASRHRTEPRKDTKQH